MCVNDSGMKSGTVKPKSTPQASDRQAPQHRRPNPWSQIATSRCNEEGATETAQYSSCDEEERMIEAPKANPKCPRNRHVTDNEYVLNVAFVTFFSFTILEGVFAYVARSESMFGDAAAMGVDASTYLVNLIAERIKNRPDSEKALLLSPAERLYRRERLRLWVELVPPVFSVAALIAVSSCVFRDAVQTIWQYHENGGVVEEEDVPNVGLMLIFSLLNFAIDILNVSCFSRSTNFAGGAIFMVSKKTHRLPLHNPHYYIDRECQNSTRRDDAVVATENSALLDPQAKADEESAVGSSGVVDCPHSESCRSVDNVKREGKGRGTNLNMCSAYTHVMADTLRSVTVVITATLAILFPQEINAQLADAVGAVIVSIFIAVGLGPLLLGIFSAWVELSALKAPTACHSPSSTDSSDETDQTDTPMDRAAQEAS